MTLDTHSTPVSKGRSSRAFAPSSLSRSGAGLAIEGDGDGCMSRPVDEISAYRQSSLAACYDSYGRGSLMRLSLVARVAHALRKDWSSRLVEPYGKSKATRLQIFPSPMSISCCLNRRPGRCGLLTGGPVAKRDTK